MFDNIIFRQLFDAASSTYTYVVGDPQSLHAVIIDTVFEQHFRDRALVEELGLQLQAGLDTHCHAGMRSGQATVILRYGGLPRVANLHGGMLLWQQMGLPVQRSTGRLPNREISQRQTS